MRIVRAVCAIDVSRISMAIVRHIQMKNPPLVISKKLSNDMGLPVCNSINKQRVTKLFDNVDTTALEIPLARADWGSLVLDVVGAQRGDGRTTSNDGHVAKVATRESLSSHSFDSSERAHSRSSGVRRTGSWKLGRVAISRESES